MLQAQYIHTSRTKSRTPRKGTARSPQGTLGLSNSKSMVILRLPGAISLLKDLKVDKILLLLSVAKANRAESQGRANY